MKYFLVVCTFLLSFQLNALPMHYFGELNGSGSYQGTISSASSWVNPPLFGLNSFSQQVNLWGFEAKAGDILSVDMLTGLDFAGGFSIYFGEVSSQDLLLGLFNNTGNTGNALYIGGTSTFMADHWVSDILLDNTGFYTLIAGGKSGFGFGTEYNYVLNVVQTSATAVAEPASLALLLSSLLLFGCIRRR
ncbi:hypothetical protein [Alkalimonas mucilaginosa]|uniref:PEP-CTERM protein-sorting domain-containing protein n=1 Tax=Alkalimonas mucilaginosa TaxID=3057676 RepID=A0ABU7JJ93_9GAMM|nr:hypothetical protein [Alkalimonas sp. MEB004]MEE2025165.1 hypothetical protein [Alkalimonas sp. MEB004]